jgi:hypothetical protein
VRVRLTMAIDTGQSEPLVIHERPDMAGDYEFGRNYLKRFPRFVRSTWGTFGDGEGRAVHIVSSVEVIWWQAHFDKMVRTVRPDFNVNLRCGNSFLIRQEDIAPRCVMLTGCGSGQPKCKGCWKRSTPRLEGM